MPFVTEHNLTDVAAERWSDIPDPRLRQVMTAAVRHLHAFVREVEPTPAEWFAAVDFLTRTGAACTANRQEVVLLSDVLGVSMLVDAINNRLATGATPTAVEGPFHLEGSPARGTGESMAEGAPGDVCFVVGRVCDTAGRPVGGVELDIWQTDGEGRYESTRSRGDDGPWMRAIYRSGEDGGYLVRTVAPLAYTIPMDGPVGELIGRTDIGHMRPAHIHFHLSAPGYHPVTTQLYRRDGPFLEEDAVFGVKEALIVDFEPRPPGAAPNGERVEAPWLLVRHDFVRQPR